MKANINSIALFGTSADPPTLGHQALLRELTKVFPKVITWASDNPDKKHQISLLKRTELLKILVQKISHPKLELVQELSSPRTIHTLKKALELWPEANFSFVIGSDLAVQIPKWLNAESILSKAKIAIVIRDGWPISVKQLDKIKKLGGKVDLLPFKIPRSSSSKFRERPQERLVPSELVPTLLEENLYGLADKRK
ncbi:nicotinate-nucleotide adenylyltransferase [Prochlorococcus marinus]|uniref:nicotinate-nucleotide adenylyltransferase n=1 Tax=Prochlorococcus marinus XMU1408 TaxID=2213228 RepID=A0A318QX39_PROMR|nr:nicotinate-nucleotide adenylyltransferase [Prochlorococcus marinus]MBW3042620.1 nicotinate-nucleotide adenylyltransferase [Prochlorococcus marinus str. XMU1408]PYE01316.1 nicotinate-nucleotide adenylyltransferase [Prochlorococcus marinus XMU1408]